MAGQGQRPRRLMSLYGLFGEAEHEDHGTGDRLRRSPPLRCRGCLFTLMRLGNRQITSGSFIISARLNRRAWAGGSERPFSSLGRWQTLSGTPSKMEKAGSARPQSASAGIGIRLSGFWRTATKPLRRDRTAIRPGGFVWSGELPVVSRRCVIRHRCAHRWRAACSSTPGTVSGRLPQGCRRRSASGPTPQIIKQIRLQIQPGMPFGIDVAPVLMGNTARWDVHLGLVKRTSTGF